MILINRKLKQSSKKVKSRRFKTINNHSQRSTSSLTNYSELIKIYNTIIPDKAQPHKKQLASKRYLHRRSSSLYAISDGKKPLGAVRTMWEK